MRNIATLLFGLTVFWCQYVSANELEDFGNQMSYFYLSPSQKSFEILQKNADQFQDELDSASNGAGLLVAVMIAKTSQAYNWPVGNGVFGKRAREILEGKSRLAKYVMNDSQVDPTKLDIWWASFFAAGDEKFLTNIFQYAGLELPKGDMARMLVIGAATWSFKANCRQHKKVLEFAKQKLDVGGLSESQESFIRECIKYASGKSTEQGASVDVLDSAALHTGRV